MITKSWFFKLLFTNILVASLALPTLCLASWTTIINPSAKADKASEALMAKTKNVSVESIVKMAEHLVSPQEFEELVKSSKPAKDLKIDSIKHGDDVFYLQAGPIKLVFKWINKNNIAYRINGHSFTYEEAAKTELWQKKIQNVVNDYQAFNDVLKKRSLKNISSDLKPKSASWFHISLGHKISSMLVLPILFQATQAEAFMQNVNWRSPYVLTAIAAVAITLIANHYYKKHKKEHAGVKSKIVERLNNARANLAAAQERGEQNLSTYQKAVLDLENLVTEYNSPQNQVGFFGFLFGSRMSKPAMYDTIMSLPNNSSGNVPGLPTAPPTGTTVPATGSGGAF